MRPDSNTSVPSLIDRFGRSINYLRISITDRCDFRCVYCMSENMTFLPRAQLLTLEEMLWIAQAFVELGVSKIRITGGEPLIRRGALPFMRQVGLLPGLNELVMTTNGSQLSESAVELRAAGVKRINISLDTLDPRRFREITRTGDLPRVLNGIDAAIAAGFERVKLNAVVLKNRNHEDATELAAFAVEKKIDISFIEEMPLGNIIDHDRSQSYYSSDEIRRDLNRRFMLLPVTESSGGPARYFRIAGTVTRIGFISPHSHNFCGDCNRVRLTSEGRLLLCLGNEHSVDLKRVVRSHPGNMEKLKGAIVGAMKIKPERHLFELTGQPVIFRHMNASGG
ncbi:GTP 3',8-cyclase MoaA [Candidatus Methylospira mobilis]|uniref:GTP 3',8-cyclase n=1 Tax=Candidatus Methylospira mobilis TaxID=1808979 RepID=A0A5Q0BCG6_9GAMM|nr:GTP 3',8-cyclase MoaA [Candidatus Methylospira mobilis]QFY41490.1 GTP 3',8-cyclase MoaA [Candidatus Methylospira mobilis]WNV05281.1 GTP 3',8-cyclase MoaA [Candidatus Methylospira mobilis]